MQDRYMEETAKSRGFSGRETDTSTYEYIKIHKDIARSFFNCIVKFKRKENIGLEIIGRGVIHTFFLKKNFHIFCAKFLLNFRVFLKYCGNNSKIREMLDGYWKSVGGCVGKGSEV